MIKRKGIVFLLGILFLFTALNLPAAAEREKAYGCKSEMKKPAKQGDKTVVLTAGNNFNGVPCYWIGTKKVDLPLPTGYSGNVKAICEFNGKIITAGGYYNSTGDPVTRPCYWEGTKWIDLPLPEGCNTGTASKVYIEKKRLIVTGFFENKDHKVTVCYWSGKKRTDCPTEIVYEDYKRISVFYNEGKIYSTGDIITGDLPDKYKGYAYYLEGNKLVCLPIPDGADSGTVESLGFSKGKVYAAGGYWIWVAQGIKAVLYPCYWEGGRCNDLPVPEYAFYKAGASDICINNGKPYISGNGGNYAFFWEGNRVNGLSEDSSLWTRAEAVFEYKGIVYTAGTADDCRKPCYWLGTSRVDLEVEASGEEVLYEVNDIYVTSSKG